MRAVALVDAAAEAGAPVGVVQSPAAADERHPVGDVGNIVVTFEGAGRYLGVDLKETLRGIGGAVVAGDAVALEVYVAVYDIPEMLVVKADLDVGVADLLVIDLGAGGELQLGRCAGDPLTIDISVRIDAEVVGLAVFNSCNNRNSY